MISSDEILNAHILIVDDQEANVQLLEQLLADSGYTHVNSCMKPEQVSELHWKNAYDLILLDLQMPVMDGFQVMQALKKYQTDGYLPIIVLTAQPNHKLRALESGAKDFISKPFDLLEVKTRIRNMLEVRLLYKKLEKYADNLEILVHERTAELRESEERFRRLTELSTDWHWQQDESGHFLQISGPVLEILGMDGMASENAYASGWNESEREELQGLIAARQPFIDFIFSRTMLDGSQQKYRVSGEPMFDLSSRFIGYRGVGVECAADK